MPLETEEAGERQPLLFSWFGRRARSRPADAEEAAARVGSVSRDTSTDESAPASTSAVLRERATDESASASLLRPRSQPFHVAHSRNALDRLASGGVSRSSRRR